MYIKISTGTGFLAAATYNERGISQKQQKQKKDKVSFLGGFNLLSTDAAGIAAEMVAVASRSRTEKPVWNVSMSAAKSQKLTDDQWFDSFTQYMMEAGIDIGKHQVAIWRHSDTINDHVHGMINAVPIDGSPALKRYHNGKRAKRAAEIIDYTLQQPVFLHRNIKDELGEQLESALLQQPCDTEDLSKELAERGVLVKYIKKAAGIYGVTFQLADQDHKPVKGSSLQIYGKAAKWNTISAQLDANKAQYQAEIERLRQEKAEAENARRRAEQERDQAENKPVTIKEVVVVKEVSDPADKAEIDRLINELNKANYKADRFKALGTTILDENDKLRQVNEELTRKLQTKEVNHRVNEFYASIGYDGKAIVEAGGVESYLRRQKGNGSFGIISTFLAQDFPNPVAAKVEIEKKIEFDCSQNDRSVYVPKAFLKSWWDRPNNERFVRFRTNVESEEWRNTRNNLTLSPPQIQCVKSLEKMRLDGNSGGPKEDQKRQIKH
jgi:hypothetical protein